ncbi:MULTISPECIES: 3-oxoacyl-ACP reductase FabG [Spirosoma]|uniref:3-oxoacyl-ACP reductase FabG n=1 Tax=Spirosoma sordidisoli TaxID=2502893 RepID=A0A4Q2UGG2_9BACT|nr:MULTISPECIES: 3-oxoacyl-ACP reductase FabG [Spirosoma]RYC68453.1 3-oxoacyl-ACP reductase FabG [Spirosoma sordidisoli]
METPTKYALVTGGSRGIGRAVCLSLAERGYAVLINYCTNKEAAESVLEAVYEAGGQAELLQFDVSKENEVTEAISGWLSAHPDAALEVLVNNAGLRRDRLMALIERAEWDKVIDTNVGGFFYVTRQVLPRMIRKRYGRIVNVVSLSGIKGAPGQTHYSASKAAVIGATKALAQEVAIKNIAVNAIAPGFIRTEMIADISEDHHKMQIPMRRFGEPEEVAALTAFLSSRECSYLTGQVISINGGLYT